MVRAGQSRAFNGDLWAALKRLPDALHCSSNILGGCGGQTAPTCDVFLESCALTFPFVACHLCLTCGFGSSLA